VGFGKTEVALRAAFCSAINGKQVAIVAPTTLLARQHFRTFSQRFSGLPIRIGRLSRMVGAVEARETKKDLAEGRVDILVGTHAILGKGVSFSDLGLVIIDEEQHFGVRTQGAAERATRGSPCPHALRDADPAHTATRHDRRARAFADHDAAG